MLVAQHHSTSSAWGQTSCADPAVSLRCCFCCRDVKPSNFLFLSEHADAPLKAIDFGMATYCGAGQKLEEKAGERWQPAAPFHFQFDQLQGFQHRFEHSSQIPLRVRCLGGMHLMELSSPPCMVSLSRVCLSLWAVYIANACPDQAFTFLILRDVCKNASWPCRAETPRNTKR